MNWKIFYIALRNVFKNKRRSTLNMLTFALNVFVILVGFGIQQGQLDSMINKMIDLQIGHIKIYAKGYTDEKRTLPLDINIADPGKVIDAIKGAPGFVAASPRIIHPGIISDTNRKMNVIVNGIDMDMEKKILTAYDKIDGSGLGSGAEVIVGKKLAEIMKLSGSENLMLYSQTVYNANNLEDVDVKGIYSVGFDNMEKINVFIPYAFAQRFFDMKGHATEIIIKLKDMGSVPQATKYIKGVLASRFPGLEALDWKEEAPELIETVRMKHTSLAVFTAVLLFLAFFIITNTITMTVYERIPEIGTLRAMGLEKGQVRSIFITEGILLGIFGVIIGYIVSAPMMYYLVTHGIYIDPSITAALSVPMDFHMKAANSPVIWIMAGVICIIAGLFGAYFPANMAAETKIVDALKRGVK